MTTVVIFVRPGPRGHILLPAREGTARVAELEDRRHRGRRDCRCGAGSPLRDVLPREHAQHAGGAGGARRSSAHPADGRRLRARSAPRLGLLPGAGRPRDLAPHDGVPGAGALARARHDLPVRHGHGPAQPVLVAGARDGRRPDGRQRKAAARAAAGRRLAHVRRSRPGHQRAAERRRRQREEPVQHRALHVGGGAQHDHVHVPHRQPRHLPLAVLRAVRRELHLRKRRADADDRLDGRPAEGRLTVTTDGLVPGQPGEPLHARRVVVIWAVLTVVAVPLVVLLLGPHLPPGNLSDEARDQRHVNIVLAALATPVLLGVWVYFVYAIMSFRQGDAALEDGPPLRGHTGAQVLWVVATGAIVVMLAGWG